MQDRNIFDGAIEVIPERLYYNSFRGKPPSEGVIKCKDRDVVFFSIDDQLIYWNFFLDFGPLNLGQLYRFCARLNSLLGVHQESVRSVKSFLGAIEKAERTVCFFSGHEGERRANAIFLMSAWQILYLDRSPEEAFARFSSHVGQRDYGHDYEDKAEFKTEKQYDPIPPFHDASPGACTYDLMLLDVLKGLAKARLYGFFHDFKGGRFNVEEYEHFEMVENGDLNWIVEGQFLAFAGPQNKREVSREGYVTLTPEDYVDYFIKRNVNLVVRLNKKCYDEGKFLRNGIGHVEHYYLDGSCPTKAMLNQVVKSFEECIFEVPHLRRTGRGVAVHCKAGLGRTGTCIGAFLMKHYKFTAAEAIGWMRLCRPGMVIGPQQHFLQDIEQEMWHEGDILRMSVPDVFAKGKNPKDLAGSVPPLHHETVQDNDKRKRRSTRIKLSPSGIRNSFRITDEANEVTQGDVLRAAHSRSIFSHKDGCSRK